MTRLPSGTKLRRPAQLRRGRRICIELIRLKLVWFF
jgi:hypothetical protein